MLPFFRKIRYRLAEDNQFLKYSRYAIGEIVLVVIGILIALYINNWNEERKEREKFDHALVDVEREIVSNIMRCRQVLQDFNDVDLVANRVMYDELTTEDYLKEDNIQALSQIAIWYDATPIQNESYLNLKQLTGNRSRIQDSILTELSTLYTEEKRWMDVMADEAHNQAVKNRNVYTQFDWYEDWWLTGRKNEEMIKFLVNDRRHKAAVIDYSAVVLENLRRMIENFEIHGLRTYREIYEYLEKSKVDHSDSLYFEYNPDDFRHYVGTYIAYDNSRLVNPPGDSLVISIEDDKLYYSPYFEGRNTKREIIPVNELFFRTEFGRGYYRLSFDENNNVVEHIWSNGAQRIKHKKIR